MPSEKEVVVYQNTNCMVIVTISTNEKFWLSEDKKFSYDMICVSEKRIPFAIVEVRMVDDRFVLSSSVVHKGTTIETVTTGPFWNRKKIIVGNMTQEERLTDAILEAIKFASSHNNDMESANQTLKEIKYHVSALSETGLIAKPITVQ